MLCRKFAVQCLESKVIPILAGIIAFIDTNRNLDILTSITDTGRFWKILVIPVLPILED
jgi:hypothetical protein